MADEAEARRLHREEHEQACEEAIALRDATYGRQRSAMEKRVEAQAMSMCLETVPANEILPLMKTEIQEHPNRYPPKAPDLLRRFKGEEWIADDDGKEERVVVANAAGGATYELLKPTENEIARREAAAKNALPEADGDGRQKWRALGEKFQAMRVAEVVAQPAAAARLTPATDKMLSAALYDYLGMETWRLPREELVGFGTWLLARFDVEVWTPDLGRREWQFWQKEKLAESCCVESSKIESSKAGEPR